jgi:hypothetical protein
VLETHLATLRNCAACGWDEADCLCHLKASLKGNATTILWNLSPECSEAELLKLHNWYGNKGQIERFRFEPKHIVVGKVNHWSYCMPVIGVKLLRPRDARDALIEALDCPEYG